MGSLFLKNAVLTTANFHLIPRLILLIPMLYPFVPLPTLSFSLYSLLRENNEPAASESFFPLLESINNVACFVLVSHVIPPPLHPTWAIYYNFLLLNLWIHLLTKELWYGVTSSPLSLNAVWLTLWRYSLFLIRSIAFVSVFNMTVILENETKYSFSLLK